MALLNLNEQATSRLPLEPIKKTDGMGYIYNGCIPATIIEDKKVPKDIGFSSLKMDTIFVNKTIAFV